MEDNGMNKGFGVSMAEELYEQGVKFRGK